ncbi:Arylsulfatase [Rosistilla carotiformis]|uniref:Arylsulfatase n=1 Tax=Rosistilla carotiformis TaxID=2528017 RepID=A0A518JVS4_9BACT|nr:sulfatase-like hydrolase/transferase [Rosistilla carotiformis]QDV69639.1 Arylsulfatase [Rosistilla carotiformis]
MKIAFRLLSLVILNLSVSLHAAERPNIVLIMADDVSWEAFGCYGAEDYQTPHIDAMAARGVRFSHCYSTPICTTSRVMIMSGKYNFRNYTHFGYLNPQEKTVANLLRDAGYKTAVAGKWQLNGLYNELPGHDDATRPNQLGFDEYALWQLTRTVDSQSERFWSPPIEQNGRFISAEENNGKYGPDLFCDFLCDFMARNRDEPFFAYYPMVLVHNPFVPTPDTIGDRDRSQAGNRLRKQKKENFQAMVHYMDKIVGRIVAKTEALGIADNTLILFTSDNGTHTAIRSQWNGQTIRGGKGGMTDMGTHVPLVAYWRGHTAVGNVVDDLVDFTDIYPTLAATAGVSLGQDDPIDGRSFLPQLRGEVGQPRDSVFCHYEPYWNKVPGQFARTAQYKLYRDGRFYEPAKDLEERNDLSDKPAQEAQTAARHQLQAILDSAPPAPSGNKAGRNTEDRPVYPDWKPLRQTKP